MTTSFWHPFADMGAVSRSELVIERGEGIHVFDDQGRRYLDGTASLWYANLGHGARRRHARRDRADGEARGLPDVRRLLERARERALRAAGRAGADGGREGLPRLGRRRRDRHRGEDRAAALDPAGAARARPHPEPHQRLPRHARVRDLDRRDRGEHVELGPADPARLGGRRSTRCPRSRTRSCASGPSTSRPSSASR